MYRTLLSVFILVSMPMAATAQLAFDWATQIGGTSAAVCEAMALRSDGSANIVGFFTGSGDFDSGPGTTVLTASYGSPDAFIVKVNASGGLVWAKQVGGDGPVFATAVTADSSGGLYVCGMFVGLIDFDPGPGVSDLTPIGAVDCFLLKLDSNGDFVWAKRFGGGQSYTLGLAIALNGAGHVCVSGSFVEAADFDPSAASSMLTSSGRADAFVAMLDSNGDFMWAGAFGGAYDDEGLGLATDPDSNVLVVGRFGSTADFDPGAGVSSLTSAGDQDIFVVKLNPSGGFQWAGNIGGTSFDHAYGISADSAGNVYVAGLFGATADLDPSPGIHNATATNFWDAFVTKLHPNGSLAWAAQFDGSGFGESCYEVSVDNDGSAIVTGRFDGVMDCDPSASVSSIAAGASGFGTFAIKLQSTGKLVWAANFDTPSNPDLGWRRPGLGEDSAINGSGRIALTGVFNGVGDFDPGPGAFQLTATGEEVFLAQLNDASSCSYRALFDSEWPLLATALGLSNNQAAAPGEHIPERWGIAMVRTILCNTGHPHHAATLAAYTANLAALESEGPGPAAQVSPYKHVLAALLCVNQSRQDYFTSLIGLANSYQIVHTTAKSPTEVFADDGDVDGDGATNSVEYDSVVAAGGLIDALVAEAIDNPNPPATLPVGARWVFLGMVLLAGLFVARYRSKIATRP